MARRGGGGCEWYRGVKAHPRGWGKGGDQVEG